ncbi:MAG: ArsR/SmtB family transcription factor [Bacilli bacterium]
MQEIMMMSEKIKAVADPTRLKILAVLKDGEQCVCELVPILNISQPAVSQHLRRLKQENIITERRNGNWMYYRLHEHQAFYIQAILNELPAMEKGTCCNERV